MLHQVNSDIQGENSCLPHLGSEKRYYHYLLCLNVFIQAYILPMHTFSRILIVKEQRGGKE